MDIRDATADDIPAIHAIYHHYVTTSVATLQEDLPTTNSMESTFRRLVEVGMPYLVAVDRVTDRICGYAYGDFFNERSGYSHTTEDSVYIDPEFCGKGIARSLLQQVFQRLREQGKKIVIAKMSILPSAAPDSLPSARLHMSMGFREVGRLRNVGFKLGTLVDVIIFQLDLE